MTHRITMPTSSACIKPFVFNFCLQDDVYIPPFPIDIFIPAWLFILGCMHMGCQPTTVACHLVQLWALSLCYPNVKFLSFVHRNASAVGSCLIQLHWNFSSVSFRLLLLTVNKWLAAGVFAVPSMLRCNSFRIFDMFVHVKCHFVLLSMI